MKRVAEKPRPVMNGSTVIVSRTLPKKTTNSVFKLLSTVKPNSLLPVMAEVILVKLDFLSIFLLQAPTTVDDIPSCLTTVH